MAVSVNFSDAELSGMALAQIGNPLRQEGLRTSKNLCKISEDDAELLALCFLKPFKSLELHRLEHPDGLNSNPLYCLISNIFENPQDNLIEGSAGIARHLYDASKHPNIKSGDLCVTHLTNMMIDGEKTDAVSIIKSESKVPFLQVTASGEDLQLTTQQGIYPDKIDKGCLIINHGKDEGYKVYLFDKSGNAQFWRCEFVNASPVQDNDYLTRRYSEMCVAFANSDVDDIAMKEERVDVAKKAVSYLTEAEAFDMEDFREVALVEPKVSKDFEDFKNAYEEEQIGQPLANNFVVSKKEAKKAERKINSRMQLDVGVDLRFSNGFQKASEQFMEKGFDESKQMKFVKIYYHAEG
ncbi:MAG: nucleoid-associated protein [Verrucomicrobiales bacterium]|nr:nucleoid-associated protein [Verrucomicrobiales bacterium]